MTWAGIVSAVAVSLVLVLALGIYLIGVSGIGREQLRARAEQAIERLAGRDMAAAIGGARVSLDGTRILGLEVSNVSLTATDSRTDVADVGAMRFGLRLLPLLWGEVELGSVSLSDARIIAGPLRSDQPRDWTLPFRDADGMLAPGKAPDVVFAALQRVFTALQHNSDGTLTLEDVSVVLPGEAAQTVMVNEAQASLAGTVLSFSADGMLNGRTWSASGEAEAQGNGELRLFDITLQSDPPPDAGGASLGSAELKLSGGRPTESAPAELRLRAAIMNGALDLGTRGRFEGQAEIEASVLAGASSLVVEKLAAGSNGSSLQAHGSIEPQAGSYTFAFAGEPVLLVSGAASEGPLRATGTLEGRYDVAARTLVASRFAVKTPGGSAEGDAALRFVPGKTPGLRVALTVPKMPVTEAKGLWPVLAAHTARAWALAHVHGGMVEDSRLVFDAEPGRLGSGQPPLPEELTAEFSVLGTRFDLAGALPSVDKADGYLTLRGNAVDISLAAGEVTLPSGRTLKADGGQLKILTTGHPPLIGKLDLNLAGETAAAAEFAALEPLNAMQRVPVAIDGIGGTFKAAVKADIPLSRGVPRDTLDWAVNASVEAFSLKDPLEGQRLSDASGTIAVTPEKADIQLSGKLNGEAAKLDIVEPIRPSGPERRRLVELQLDAEGVRRLAPGLGGLVSGPLMLQADVSAPERKVEIDLSKARLDLPWLGWSKGAGIGAKARFTMAKDGEATRIGDLRIEGESFSAGGSATLDGGGLAGARLSEFKLNRDDAVSVAVERSGKQFRVSVEGKRFDARSLLRMVTASGTSEGGSGRRSGPSVAVSARVDEVAGFNGESWRNAVVDYRSNGALSLEAQTGEGGAVTASDARNDGQRDLALRSADAGSVLRFLNIYPHMRGGSIDVSLKSAGDGPLEGRIDARDFLVVDEPRLASVVSTRAAGSARSLNEAVDNRIDTSAVRFDRGSALISKGPGSLRIADGVLRGTSIGSTFQGTLYDTAGNIDMTGTFMPAYGVNRLFGELPLLGVILGNGRDRGLIGVTFRLSGDAKSPVLDVNPLSAIAPGIFRRIFEYY